MLLLQSKNSAKLLLLKRINSDNNRRDPLALLYVSLYVLVPYKSPFSIILLRTHCLLCLPSCSVSLQGKWLYENDTAV